VAKNKNDRFASVNDFAAALEAAVSGSLTAAPSRVSATAQLPSVVSPKTTTFTQSSGELGDDDDLDVPPTRPKWHWALAAGAALVLLLVAFLLLRPRPPLVADGLSKSGGGIGAGGAIDAAPQVDFREKEQSSATPSGASAEKSPPESGSAVNPLGGKRHRNGKHQTQRKDGEGEDRWRVE
jgi:hypothetical protein